METESRMCRICLGQGRYNIFVDHLSWPPTEEEISTAAAVRGTLEILQGRRSRVAIVDALNYFCEFKISPSETTNEPTMLCEGCCAALLQAYQFRIKLNEAEQTLQRSRDSLDTCSDTKTSLTLQLDEIEPFLDDPSPPPEDAIPAVKPPKIHHAKPRFQLTNQVSNILRHVAASSQPEKRKEPSGLLDSSTPKKIQRRNEEDSGRLNKTLIVPNYIFAGESGDRGGGGQLVSISSNQTPSEPSDDEKSSEHPASSYCQHCRRAYSLPHCLKHLPTVADRKRQLSGKSKVIRRTLPPSMHVFTLQQQQVPARPEEIPATGGKDPPEANK